MVSMVKKSLLRYAPAPWGMQPNTSPAALSPRFPLGRFPLMFIYCILYHTISGVFKVIVHKRVRPFHICFTVYACLTFISSAIPPRTSQPQTFRLNSLLRISFIRFPRQRASTLNYTHLLNAMLPWGQPP